MSKGIIYVMTTIVPGLIKIGKTGSDNFESRMYNLEKNGYRNVTALRRNFAIELDNYDEKEKLLHNIFEKSQVEDTELFALDINLVVQLLSSFDGKVIYPPSEKKEEIFKEATEITTGKLIPDGIYRLERKKRSDNKSIMARAKVENGSWVLLKGSVLGIKEDAGITPKIRSARALLPLNDDGELLEDCELGVCAPSFVAAIVVNHSINGWTNWFDVNGKPIDIYRRIT